MLIRRSTPFLLLALLVAGAQSVAAQTPDEVLARFAKVVDPEGKIASLQGMKSTATMEMPAMGMKAAITAVQRAPNQTSVTIDLPGLGQMRQGFDGSIAWASDPMQGPRIMSGSEAAAMSDGADFRSMTRPASLFTSSELVGTVELEGEKCIRLKHTWKSGRETTDCYSVASGLLIESLSKQSSPQGEMETVQRLSDYRSVGGVMMPYKAVVSVMGMQQIVITSAVELGALDASLVAAPAEVIALKKP